MMTCDYTCRVAGHLHVICVTAAVCAVCALLLLPVSTLCDSASVAGRAACCSPRTSTTA